MKTPKDRNRPWMLAMRLLAFALLLVLGNRASQVLIYPDVGAAVIYPPYAFLTAALVVSRRRDWIWLIVIASAAHLATGLPLWPLSRVLFSDAANIARGLVAALLLNRLVGVPPRLLDARMLVNFLVSAVVAAPALGATIGAANFVLLGVASSYSDAWIRWFVSNAITGLTLLPASIAGFALVVGPYRWRLDRWRTIEAAWLLVALAATCALAFLPVVSWESLLLPLCAPLPVLIWAALRFGPGGTSLCLTVVTFAAIWSIDRATGALPTSSVHNSVIALQTFLLFTAAPLLCLAVISTARQAVVTLHQALLASLQEHVAILDANGVVLEVNDSWRRFAQETAGQLFHRVGPGDNYADACHASAMTGDATAAKLHAGVQSVLSRATRRFEIEYDRINDGRTETYSKSVEPLERAEGGAVVVRANVTARRLAQTEIDTQRLELSHLARVSMLGQLSGAFAHELNQPLTVILNNAEAARQLIQKGSPDLACLDDILRDVITADQRAASMIQRLRDLLKRGDLLVVPNDIRELIGEVLSLANAELIRRQVSVRLFIEPTLPPVLGDKVQLQQVLLNLIINGIEAMNTVPVSHRHLEVRVVHEAAAGVHLAVSDAGSGILPEMVERLFEPFVTSKQDGLGLGLSICRTIVGAHGGRIWGLNNPGGGATIHCVLPADARGRADGGATGDRSASIPVPLPSAAKRQLTVGIIDDDDSVRASLRRLCQIFGYGVTTFASGPEFLTSLAAGKPRPDCIVLDAHIPQMTGLELLQNLAARGMRIPTILCTGDDSLEMRAMYVASNFVVYLQKPVAADRLMEAIRQVMHDRRGHADLVPARDD